MIVAQGGTNHGWALHIWKDTLRFVTRHGGTLTMIADDKPFPKSAAVVVAELAKDGKVTLKIDGTVVAQGKTQGPCAICRSMDWKSEKTAMEPWVAIRRTRNLQGRWMQ